MSHHAEETSPVSDHNSRAGSTTIPRSVKIILGVLVFSAFVMMLNETTLAVALPAIMADFTITAATAQWLLTGFMLTMAIVLPTTGWLLERFATRSVFIFAIAAFLIGTVVAALAPTFVVMLVARVAQGVGTAVIMPLLMTVAMTLVPVLRRGAVMGLIAVVLAVGPALGPTVAGFVLSFTTWHGIFWVMVPLVASSAAIGIFMLTNTGTPRAVPFDLLSAILSVFAFGGVVYGLSSIGVIIEGGSAARTALIILVVGVVGLGLFIWRQIARVARGRALLNLRPLKVRNFTISVIVLMCLMAAMIGVFTTLPLYLQGSLLVTALVSGLVLLPGGLLEGALSPIAGRLYDRIGPRPLIIPGMLIFAGTLFALTFIDENTHLGIVIGIYVIFSIGLALLFTPLMTTALGSLPTQQYSHGSAILNTLMQLAGAAGTAIMLTVFSTVSESAEATQPPAKAIAEGSNAAFLVSAAVAGVALLFSLFITRVPLRPERTERTESTDPTGPADPTGPTAADDQK